MKNLLHALLGHKNIEIVKRKKSVTHSLLYNMKWADRNENRWILLLTNGLMDISIQKNLFLMFCWYSWLEVSFFGIVLITEMKYMPTTWCFNVMMINCCYLRNKNIYVYTVQAIPKLEISLFGFMFHHN